VKSGRTDCGLEVAATAGLPGYAVSRMGEIIDLEHRMPSALVIDADRAFCESMCQTLSLLDVFARPAYNAHAALLTLVDAAPDLIFLTCLGGEGAGESLEFLEFLQGESALAGIPVVMMVAEDQGAIPEKIAQVGILALIPRLASLQSLERVLRKAGMV
jgi:DNA-binding NarL/FixJ family response regulator